MKIVWVLFIFLSLPLLAASNMCSEPDNSFEDMANILKRLTPTPLTMSVTFDDSCDFRTHAETDFESGASISPEQFIKAVILNPEMIKKSAHPGAIREVNNTLSNDNTLSQEINAKSGRASINVSRVCSFSSVSASIGAVSCESDISKSRISALFRSNALFEKQKTTITCSQVTPQTKKCIYNNEGKAQGFMGKSPCFIGGALAAVDFLGIYLMSNSNNDFKDSDRIKEDSDRIDKRFDNIQPGETRILQLP